MDLGGQESKAKHDRLLCEQLRHINFEVSGYTPDVSRTKPCTKEIKLYKDQQCPKGKGFGYVNDCHVSRDL